MTFAWLEKAVEARDASALWLPTDPAFESLRSDPRYKALLGKMNLGAGVKLHSA